MVEEKEELGEVPAEYSSKSDFSKAKIVYDAVQKCVEARGNEMKEGYHNWKLTRDGFPIKTWIPDSRRIYIGYVNALKSILTPEILQNEIFKTSINNVINKTNEIENTFAYYERKRIAKDGRLMWVTTGRKYIPEIDAETIILDSYGTSATPIKGGWNDKVNLYWSAVLDEYDLIFEYLNQLINKLNYFKQKGGY